MYQDVQAVDKEVRDANMDKLAEDIQAYFVENMEKKRQKQRAQKLQTAYTT